MKMHTARLVVPLLIVVACTTKSAAPTTDTAAAKAPPSATVSDDAAARKDIEAANARVLDAIARGDTAGAVANYSPDAVVMFPNENAWKGAEAVRKGSTPISVSRVTALGASLVCSVARTR